MSDSVSETFNKLKPLIVDLITAVQNANTGSGALTAHALSGDYHTGSLADVQAPQFLKTDGSRPLTGNLEMENGKTIDGMDPSAFLNTYNTHLDADSHPNVVHNHNTRNITAQHVFAPEIARAPFTLHANAQNQVVPGLRASSVDVSVATDETLVGGAVLHDDISLAVNRDADFEWYGTHSWSQTMFTHSLIPVEADLSVIGSESSRYNQLWASEIQATIFALNSAVLLGGLFYVTKDAGSLPEYTGPGATAINFGKAMTPNDYVVFRGDNTVEYMKVLSLVSGTTYNVTRSLDPSGVNTWEAGTPFAVFGQNGNGRIELSATDTPQLRVLLQGVNYSDQTEMVRVGDLKNWGDVGASSVYGAAFGAFETNKANILIDSTGALKIRRYTTTVMQLDTTGAYLNAPMTFGDGGGFYRGTGTFASPTRGIKLGGVGSYAVIEGYNAGVLQAAFNDSGEITAGAGKVKLNSRGAEVLAASNGYNGSNGYQIVDGSAVLLGGLFGWRNTAGLVDGHYNQVELNANPYAASNASKVLIQAKSTNPASIELNTLDEADAQVMVAAETIGLGRGAGYTQFSAKAVDGNTKFDATYRRFSTYDGARWLGEEQPVPFIGYGGPSYSVTGSVLGVAAVRGDLAMRLQRGTVVFRVDTTNTSVSYWTIQLRINGVVCWTFNTYDVGAGRTAANTYYRVETTTFSSHPTTASITMDFIANKAGATGTPGTILIYTACTHRLILP